MNKRIVTVLIVGLSIVVLLGILFIKKGPRVPIIFAEGSGSYPEKSLDDLIYEGDAIVIGKFDTAFPSKWSTPNGKLPSNANLQTVYGQRLYIYTEYIFQVEEFLKGETSTSSIIIRTFGGQVGLDMMTVDSHEPYEIGQTYLLFLHYDPRLAIGEDPGPFLIFHPATYHVSNGRATSWRDEWDEKELRNYIIHSPFSASKTNTPDSPEAVEIINKVKTAADLEVEARDTFDPEKFREVFINDPRFPVNSETLEFIKNSTTNPSLETAGYLDYKIAEYTNPGTRMNDRIYLSSIWIKFVSVRIDNDTASVIIEPGERGRFELTLVQIDGEWFITGMRGITIYEDNSPPSVIDPNIPQTPEYLDVINKVEEAYDVYSEAIYTLDTSKLSNVYNNNDQYPVNSETLESIRNSTQNSNIQSAGYLDYKSAYVSGWKTTPEWSRSPYREQILVFSGVKIEGTHATVHIRPSLVSTMLYLVNTNGKWYIVGKEGVTVSSGTPTETSVPIYTATITP